MKNMGSIAKTFVIMGLVAILPHKVSLGQVGNTGELLRGSMQDAEILVTEYINPYASGLGALTNTGFITSGRTHKLLGFDISARVSATIIPSKYETFSLLELPLNNLRPSAGNAAITSTVSGPDRRGPTVEVFERITLGDGTQTDYVITSFEMPSGSGFGYALAPMVQLGVGVPLNTDVIIRFMPTISIEDYGDFNIIGFGINHDIKQWLDADLPFNLSVMGGYTRIGLNGGFLLRPGAGEYDTDPGNVDRDVTWQGQKALLTSTAWNFNLIIGKSIPFLNVYAGIGVQQSNFNVSFDGTFPVYNLVLDEMQNPIIELGTIMEPFEVNIDSGAVFRAMAGFSVKLGPIKLVGDITHADFLILNAGVAISIR